MAASPSDLSHELDDHTERGAGAATVTGVRYGAMKWVGEFRIAGNTVVHPGAPVVVQTERGIELGEQLPLTCRNWACHVRREQIRQYLDNSGGEFYRLNAGQVLREATLQDIDEHERLNSHVREDVRRCTELARRLNLDMKVITAEHLLGGERIVFYFRSEGRVDFRELVRELARHYRTRIEMRQVGARDEARLIADYEVCGRECCCRTFLKKLRPVTMRMAKLQKSTLDPTKVSGRCGRLRCCLRYEHEGYDELLRRLPRIGTRVETEAGPATVVDRQILTQLLLVRYDDNREVAIPLEEIGRPGAGKDEPQPGQAAAAPPAAAAQDIARGTEERPRRRRRSRRRRKTGSGQPAAPERPAAAQPPQVEPTADEPAAGPTPPRADAAPESAASRRARRRSRKRRPRRQRPDGPPPRAG